MKGLRMTEEELQEFLRRGQKASEEAARAAGRRVDVIGARNRDQAAVDKIDFEKRLWREIQPKQSKLEARFTQQLDRVENMPKWVRNYFAIPSRDFEIDFAFPDWRFGVEIDGGAHQAAGRARRDYEKHLLLVLNGWTVLRLDGQLVRSGRGIELVLEIMRARGLFGAVAR